jgi:hypothetical protein
MVPMPDKINATDHEMTEQVLGIRALMHAFSSDWQPRRIANFAAGAQGLPIGEYHLLLPGNNSGDATSPLFNAMAVQSSFVGLAGSVSKKFSSINDQLAQAMASIIEAGKLFDNADFQAALAAQRF